MKTKFSTNPGLRPRSRDVAQIWADVEDHLVPNLHLGLAERALYLHLVRVARCAGKRIVRTSLSELAAPLCLTKDTIRAVLQRLAHRRAIKILEAGYAGHNLEVFLPREIPHGIRRDKKADESLLEREDCFRSGIARLAIFEREKHRCFYCLAHLGPKTRALDHVRPLALGGDNTYRNVVACCFPCNSLKKNSEALQFLRNLRRQEIIDRRDLRDRVAALRALKLGRLKPKWPKADGVATPR